MGQDFVLYRSDLDPAQAKVVICREVIAMMTTAGSTHDLAPIIGQLLAPVLMAHGGLDVVRRILGDVPLERNKVLDDEAARPAADVIPIGRARRSAN
ncbi:hypothetical protein FDA94_28560 [Herbidospora galbida]|uniref:Uncharacterized protein n=1 Tax=Herbidospora galbida TaxID=2575442 RepID=A0A4U3M959_9ACTN|nr:hypothetical protein [Herbidospora galbida]TKK84584.1 hypothetical protein FDA94_28560 [Herbidospora galbida]